MRIDDNYSITKDQYSWTLRYKSVRFDKKKGKDITSSDQWDYPTIKLALKAYLDKSLKDVTFVKDIIARIEEAEAKIDGIC